MKICHSNLADSCHLESRDNSERGPVLKRTYFFKKAALEISNCPTLVEMMLDQFSLLLPGGQPENLIQILSNRLYFDLLNLLYLLESTSSCFADLSDHGSVVVL